MKLFSKRSIKFDGEKGALRMSCIIRKCWGLFSNYFFISFKNNYLRNFSPIIRNDTECFTYEATMLLLQYTKRLMYLWETNRTGLHSKGFNSELNGFDERRQFQQRSTSHKKEMSSNLNNIEK
jgi:hypothetical protein